MSRRSSWLLGVTTPRERRREARVTERTSSPKRGDANPRSPARAATSGGVPLAAPARSTSHRPPLSPSPPHPNLFPANPLANPNPSHRDAAHRHPRRADTASYPDMAAPGRPPSSGSTVRVLERVRVRGKRGGGRGAGEEGRGKRGEGRGAGEEGRGARQGAAEACPNTRHVPAIGVAGPQPNAAANSGTCAIVRSTRDA